MAGDPAFMDKLTALCKRRGFIYQSSEIYGGIGGFWDYGPLGVELKRNIKNLWWHDMVTNPPAGFDGREVEMVGVDCSIIMNPRVWEASGHATGFADPMCDCRECRKRLRADQVLLVTIMPQSGVANLAAVSTGASEPEFTADAERRTTVGFEIESGQSMADAVTAAVREYARKNNIGFLKKFQATEEGSKGRFQYVRADDGKGGPLACFVEVLSSAQFNQNRRPCPSCRAPDGLTEPRAFNLMFQTYVGALQDASALAYLRPETAQGIFANFKNVLDTTRVKVPFGIAQVGKSFRNEINPRNYTFRSREFEQMEIEFFCHERDSMLWYEFWRKVRFDWYVNLGLKSEKLRLRDQGPEELAHYSKACADIEYRFPFSDDFQELEGVAHRGCFDLTQHQQFSGKDLTYFDDEAWERDKTQFGGDKDAEKKAKNEPPYRFLPTVIEPSAGADRATLAFLCEAYSEDEAPDEKGVPQQRVVMRFHPQLAPVKVAVFPLVNREQMPEIAAALYRDLKRDLNAFYDDKGAIGRRYRRQDEIGTPYCVTVDGQTLTDGSVTIRHRDSLEQLRVAKEHVAAWVRERLAR